MYKLKKFLYTGIDFYFLQLENDIKISKDIKYIEMKDVQALYINSYKTLLREKKDIKMEVYVYDERTHIVNLAILPIYLYI